MTEKLPDANDQHVLRHCDSNVLRHSRAQPAAFSCIHQKHTAVVDIRKGAITSGVLPAKQTKLVLAWTELRRDELLAGWQLASHGELPFHIKPLE